MNLLVFKSHCPILSTKSSVDRVPVREFYWATELVTRYYGTSLMDIDELAVLDGSKCILQLRGVRPFLSRKYDITQHPNYKYLADFDKKNTFDIERFLSTKLKPKPSEVYDVFEIDVSEEEEPAEDGGELE